MDCSLPGSSVHGILQARVLEWGAIAFSNDLGYATPRFQESLKQEQPLCPHSPALTPGSSCYLLEIQGGKGLEDDLSQGVSAFNERFVKVS